MSQPEVAALKNPSTAAILAKIVGPWGAWLINIGMVISVLGAFLSWTLLASEVPFIAAQSGLFPRWFSRLNQHGTPAHGLWATTLLVQLFLLVILLQESTYLALVNITTSAALVPYFFSAAYGLKLAWQDKACGQASARDLLLGAVATGYGLWLVYAAGVTYLLLATLLYVPGLLILHLARRQQGLAWGRAERLGGLLLVCLAAWCGWSWWQGWLA